MRVTVVTLSLNQGAFLERALRSVIEQDYPVEYIVVDPGSTDGSREIIDRYRHELAHVLLDPDDGPADGLNRGFRVASGDVLAYLNADDALLPGAVRSAVRFLESHGDVDVVYGDGYIVDGEGAVVRAIESSPFNVRRHSYGRVTVLQQATFMRRSAFVRAGGFNARNPTSWDGELLLDIALAGGKVQHVSERWGVFTIHSDSITGSNRLAAQRRVELERIFRKVHGREPTVLDRLLRRGFRLEKWLVAPGSTARRLRAALVGSGAWRLTSTPGAPVDVIRTESAGTRGAFTAAGKRERPAS
jgi:glycosyltransferase involved in cell wall biosynthesis